MLYKYQPGNEKVVLGILTMSQRSHQIEFLQEEIQWYEDGANRSLYLWKDQFNNWAGVIGIEENPQWLLVRKMILAPDADTYFNAFRVLDNLKTLYPNQPILGTLRNQEVITRWERNNE
ncbi:riboflavin biosynthesis protein RibT [Fructilactobacillus carniphilus]|uniref:Riboflavin biosynthesis protein RibT n=1 Tax=Fructilactobacillus carniphilus TaxID=2940297 RepID=A0ABY5BZM9_9LACO|nr:riboflavin biosynthesis protein RibT [Fructilactobacillus carniphilus]USS91048.1 riboflavin biosynthesis protein RibT [Fructilactobacillus carniphilus]